MDIYKYFEETKMKGFYLKPLPQAAPRADLFIPFKGFENYKQSKLLQPWSKSTRDMVFFKTGLKFDEGVKGFPLELLFYLFKGMEFYLADAFDNRTTNKMEIGAKNILKTGLMMQFKMFIMYNFDFAHVMSMMKYQNGLHQVIDGIAGYRDLIRTKTGLDLGKFLDQPLEGTYDPQKPPLNIERKWFKDVMVEKKDKKRVTEAFLNEETGKMEERTVTKEIKTKKKSKKYMFSTWWRLRSFDHPQKIANTPPPKQGQAIVFVNLIEPVMYNDPNDVSAEQMYDSWSVNKSSLFRFATITGYYAQMMTDMNLWTRYHIFVQTAETLLPYDYEKIQETGTYHTTNIENNWTIRRLARIANTIIPWEGDELRESEILKARNHQLYMAMYWGATNHSIGTTPYLYRSSINRALIKMLDPLTPEELIKIDKEDTVYEHGYTIGVGVDWGTGDASCLKSSQWVPSKRLLLRHQIDAVRNKVNAKEGFETLSAPQIVDRFIQKLVEWALPYFRAGIFSKENPLVIWWDGGSPAAGQFFDAELVKQGLGEIMAVAYTKRHGKDNIKERVDFNNNVHGNGIAAYTPANQQTLEQFEETLGKASDWETREERNQPLDDIDSTDISEFEIRPEVLMFQYNIAMMSGKNKNKNKGGVYYGI